MSIAEFSDRWIVDKAIALINKHGQRFKTDDMPGYAQQAELEDCNIIYTTPSSGLEILPGKTAYMVDIWINHKKVFRCDYQTLDELNCKRPRKSDWLAQFRELT